MQERAASVVVLQSFQIFLRWHTDSHVSRKSQKTGIGWNNTFRASFSTNIVGWDGAMMPWMISTHPAYLLWSLVTVVQCPCCIFLTVYTNCRCAYYRLVVRFFLARHQLACSDGIGFSHERLVKRSSGSATGATPLTVVQWGAGGCGRRTIAQCDSGGVLFLIKSKFHWTCNVKTWTNFKEIYFAKNVPVTQKDKSTICNHRCTVQYWYSIDQFQNLENLDLNKTRILGYYGQGSKIFDREILDGIGPKPGGAHIAG